MGKRVFAVAFRLAGAALMVLSATVFSSGIYAQSKAESKTSAGKTEKQVAPTPWNKVSSSERKVLTPLEKDWNQLPGIQNVA